ncbi:hypothetical protein GLOTRDRAFT_120003 [Gloeophyllum trabeum ATCC 11539]|uniref:Anaphase-promoting complex subunit 5 n=1 Tax=Gloeophyllum trabeum (strain ATCC 11539 / FP-39264 / Madison 617) TaxID=670483 RepID=S7QFF7_GLOTA|nr:uncharacterized protein GLOTRDRAFT_120003 [Gloeophyllum trabeum ATCC 11539]EPQ58152.1 hypothetical protein GLOTRDRAFT_120003 [Gloeophyllum trabeum ATCC 11539]
MDALRTAKTTGQPNYQAKTTHVLRPHHIGLLSVLAISYKEFESKEVPAPFLLHINRLMLNEISEVAEPKPWYQLIQELSSGPMADVADALYLIESVKDVWMSVMLIVPQHKSIRNGADMLIFFQGWDANRLMFGSLLNEDLGVAALFQDNDDQEPAFTRRSPFGYFCRRCWVTFQKLSWEGVLRLQRDYAAWRAGDLQAGYIDGPMDRLNSDNLLFRTSRDKKKFATAERYAEYEKARDVSDLSTAVESLRRYFEQLFHTENDIGYRHYALLELVRYHWKRREWTVARDLLVEAQELAERAGDCVMDEYCKSLASRLPPKDLGAKQPLNTIRPNVHPYEILYDVKKLMQVSYEQPLSASFEKVLEAITAFDHWAEKEASAQTDVEQWGQHAVQSLVWNNAGCLRMSEVEENIVIAFTETASDDNNRITVIVNRANKEARRGKYREALSMLLDPDTWRGLSVIDYEHLWASELWHVLALRAARRGQLRVFNEFLQPKRPASYKHRDYFADLPPSGGSHIRDRLYEVIYYLVINGDDIEQRALACFTMARCIIVAGGSESSNLQEAIGFLDTAEADYTTLEMYPSVVKVQYLLAVIYNALGREEGRDAAAARHLAAQSKLEEWAAAAVDQETQAIWTLAMDVGASLSAR